MLGSWERSFCALPFTHIKVTPAGEVSMCCFQSGTLGNVLRQPIEEIWHSRTAEEIRATTAAGDLHPLHRLTLGPLLRRSGLTGTSGPRGYQRSPWTTTKSHGCQFRADGARRPASRIRSRSACSMGWLV
jgi:Iron-sulfur cluster-binding domain